MYIIYIIGFSPKFGYLKGNSSLKRAAKIWKNSSGQDVGIWKEDWGNQLGFELKNRYPEIEYEVWRPDVRADKVYKHIFENGVINKSFPTNEGIYMSGFRPVRDIYSLAMEKELSNYLAKKRNIRIILPAVRKKITLRISKLFSYSTNIINIHFLNCAMFFPKPVYLKNPIRFFHNYLKYKQQYYFTQSFKKLVVGHREHIDSISKYLNGKVFFNTFGTDLSYWIKVKTKQDARSELKLPQNRKIFLLSSRLCKEYQILKVLELINRLKINNIYFIFTSQGDNDYMKSIYKAIEKYELKNYVNLIGYVDKDILRDLYIASDYFFMSSTLNAGPMSSFIAILMEIPIISTDSGLAAEILKDNAAGLILKSSNINHWQIEFDKLINNTSTISLLDKSHVYELFNWNTVIDKWIKIFNE